MKAEKWLLLIFFIFLLTAYGLIGNLDHKTQIQEEAWRNSVQAVEAEQAQIEIMILEAKDELQWAKKQIEAHNLLIWDIRDRVHLDLEWDIENDWEGY